MVVLGVGSRHRPEGPALALAVSPKAQLLSHTFWANLTAPLSVTFLLQHPTGVFRTEPHPGRGLRDRGSGRDPIKVASQTWGSTSHT